MIISENENEVETISVGRLGFLLNTGQSASSLNYCIFGIIPIGRIDANDLMYKKERLDVLKRGQSESVYSLIEDCRNSWGVRYGECC